MESRPSSLHPEILVVVPEGRLDAQAAPALEQKLTTLESQGHIRIVLNLQHALYVSSSTLRIMLIHARELRQAGGDLKLCCLPDKISKVLRITGLDTVFDIFTSEALASEAFLTPAEAGPILSDASQEADPPTG
jgi:anti-anti-sigma factor